MRFIDSSSIGAISSIAGPAMVPSGGIFSLIFGGKKKKLTKAQRKKLARRRYRMFVDNIVMHHKRLHDKNREITINLAKSRLPSKAPKSQKHKLVGTLTRENQTKWRDKVHAREIAGTMRGRVDARRARARSRWVSIIDDSKNASDDPSRFVPSIT